MSRCHETFLFESTVVPILFNYFVSSQIMKLTPLFILILLLSCQAKPVQQFDLIIRNGEVYDGTGSEGIKSDVGINADTIAFIGDLKNAMGKKEIDASGLVVAPGFINMLSWADGSLLKDGRSMSDIKQGVTLEVLGEGWSPGPVRRKNKQEADSLWITLGGYFQYLSKRGMSPNVASFVGATSIRIYEMGFDNRPPTSVELQRMKEDVRIAIEEGALGISTSLIYAPANFASTEEIIELAKVAREYGGMYITHMRSESDQIYSALNETFRIAKEASIATAIYHLKINHARNWKKIDTVLMKIDSARNVGLNITANMYPYTASATGLTARIPTWAQEGGAPALRKRLRNPALRKKILKEMHDGIPAKNSDPKDVMLLGFRKDSLNTLYKGKRLDEVARIHGKDADQTVLDLVLEDKSSIPSIYFLISEENVRKKLALPYMSFGSDAASLATDSIFTRDGTHPRAYGTFARVLGKYVREEGVLTLAEAIRKLTSLPAHNLGLQKRGELRIGYFADIAVFNPATIQDVATFENPHQYALGMEHVLVNGVLVLYHGEHTAAKPGRILYGSGFSEPTSRK
jgi:N-acyl-D-amino-acid deacylase